MDERDETAPDRPARVVGGLDAGRREALKRLAAAGLLVPLSNPVGVEAAGTSKLPNGRAVYVWRIARALATEEPARERFVSRAERYGIGTVYLSWGALRTAPRSARRRLVAAMHDAGLETHAMIGTDTLDGIGDARDLIDAVTDHNERVEPRARLDGVHLNLEIGADELVPFLERYVEFLDELADDGSADLEGLDLSATIAWWWGLANHAPGLTDMLAEHPVLDYGVVMAYWESSDEVRKRLSTVVSGLDAAYVLAIETMEFPDVDGNYPVTTYEEGWGAARAIESAIESDPPADGFQGVALHHYESGLAAWDALWDVELDRSVVRRGGEVVVDATVVFDDTRPAAAHGSELAVVFEGPERYAERTTVTPPARTPTDVSLRWEVPAGAPLGRYTVTASLADLTVEDDEGGVESRSTPVVLGERPLGRLWVTI